MLADIRAVPRTFDSAVPLSDLVHALRSSDSGIRSAAAEELQSRGEPGAHLAPSALLDTLKGDDTLIRAMAAECLAEAVEALPHRLVVDILRDPTAEVRSAFLGVLGRQYLHRNTGHDVPDALILPFLTDLDDEVRRAAFQALGPRVPVDTMMRALRDPNGSVRSAAAFAAWKHQRMAAMDVLPLLHDEDPGIRTTALEMLTHLHDASTIPSLVDVLRDADAEVRRAAIIALGRTGADMPIEPMHALLYDDSLYVRSVAVRVLALHGDDDALAFIVRDMAADNELERENALINLVEGYADDMPRLAQQIPLNALMDCLHSEWFPVGIMAARIIGALGDDAPIIQLADLLRDPKPETRWAAVYALAELSPRPPIELLLAMLRDDDASVRNESVRALETYGPEVPVEELLPLLDPDDTRVAHAIAKLGHQEGIDTLVAALGSAHVGKVVPQLLAEFGERVPQEPLVAALGNSDHYHRSMAAEALYRTHPDVLRHHIPDLAATLRGERAWPILESLGHTQTARALAALKLGEAVAPVLVDYVTGLLDWPYWETRLFAIAALGTFGKSVSEPAIMRLRALCDDPESSWVRHHARHVLAHLPSAPNA